MSGLATALPTFSLLVKPICFYVSVCSDEVGFESWRIKDPAFTASSYKSSRSYPWMARLHGRGAWCARENDNQTFLQVSVIFLFDSVYRISMNIEFASSWCAYSYANVCDIKTGANTAPYSPLVKVDIEIIPCVNFDGINLKEDKQISNYDILCFKVHLQREIVVS